MAALDFPATPTVGQYFVAGNGVTYQWNGTMWLPVGGTTALYIGDTPPSNPGPGQLWFNSALATLYVYYNDGNSTQWVPTNPVPAPSASTAMTGMRVKITKFLTVGAGSSWTPDPALMAGYAVAKGGGGSSGVIAVSPTYIQGAGGGGEGATAYKYFNAGDYLGAQVVTVGAGGAASSIGSWLVASPGGTSDWAGGSGGLTGTGDLIIPGAPGSGGCYSPGGDAVAIGGSGGGAGGGRGVYSGNVGGGGVAGIPGAANTGGGASGSCGRNIGPGSIGGIAGGSGYVYVIEYLKVT